MSVMTLWEDSRYGSQTDGSGVGPSGLDRAICRILGEIYCYPELSKVPSFHKYRRFPVLDVTAQKGKRSTSEEGRVISFRYLTRHFEFRFWHSWNAGIGLNDVAELEIFSDEELVASMALQRGLSANARPGLWEPLRMRSQKKGPWLVELIELSKLTQMARMGRLAPRRRRSRS